MKLRDYQQKAVVAIFESRRPGERDDWRMSEKPSSVLALIDYRTVCQYAASCCHRKHVRACDVEDIAHAAWIDCQRRGRSAVGEENPAALARRIMFTSIQDAIRKWRGTYEHEALVLDVPTVDGRRVVTAADLSDRGAGAERERWFRLMYHAASNCFSRTVDCRLSERSSEFRARRWGEF